MPQTTQERADRWPGMDREAIQYLESEGWVLTSQWEWSHKCKSIDTLSEKEEDAILYLIEEWDFGGVNTLKIFLDDERFPAGQGDNTWMIIRDYEDFVRVVTEYGIPDEISFDHDLGDGPTGYDCAKWICDHMLDNNLFRKFDYYVHSQNPVGAKNIDMYLKNFFEHMEQK